MKYSSTFQVILFLVFFLLISIFLLLLSDYNLPQTDSRLRNEP